MLRPGGSVIETLEKPFTEQESLGSLNMYVREWFGKNFAELTPPQRFAFKLISENRNVLITAPTGSGKTLSGFLSVISKLFDYALAGKLENKVYCIYISPLRALNNDVYKNLQRPLDGVYEIIKRELGVEVIKRNIRSVSVGIRTGDTTQKERHAQLVKPPNILVTTPESLAIMLNSQKFVENLGSVEYVLVDEIHELANNKRGVHLSLSLERLADIIGRDFVRIGMGATLYPVDEAARFLVGYGHGEPRDCKIVDASWSKRLSVRVVSPVSDMINSDDKKVEDAMYKELDRVIKSGKTTLVFTNTRSGTERVVFNLKRRFKYGEAIAAHHGSLSRESRLEVEDLLKKGSLKCAVSSTSLELGIDIGAIDNVVLLGSPKSVTRSVQRIGRSGHSFRAVAKGEMIVLNRDDLIECAVMLDAALRHRLDSFRVPQNALDVLAQHMVGMSFTKKWRVDEAYELVRHAYPYHDLDRSDFIALLDYLAGNYVGLESRRVYGKIWYDKDSQMFGKRGMYTKVIYMLNLGTIPDEVAVDVINSKTGKWIGSIEEEFLTRLREGDVFTLGGRLYRFERSSSMRCYVADASSSAPTIPPWFSEQLPLSYELANDIGAFRRELSGLVQRHIKDGRIESIPKRLRVPSAIRTSIKSLPVEDKATNAIFGYFMEQLLFAGVVPNDRLLLVEQTSVGDNPEDRYVVFHSLFGRRVNDALSRLFAIELRERLEHDIGIMVSDNGFVLTIAKGERLSASTLGEIIRDLASGDVADMLRLNIRNTELIKRRFRHVAARSFMILRNYKGWKISVGKQQLNSQLLFKAAEAIDPNFPVIKETYREIFEEVMDLPRAIEVIAKLGSGEIAHRLIDTPVPSPFAHGLVTFGHADVMQMRERRMYLQHLHKLVMKRIGG
jgi:ATP-dependent Lhr-like helicase